MDPAAYDDYTRALTQRLDDDRVLALIALGSMAEPSLRDQYSDHDFWLVLAAATLPGQPTDRYALLIASSPSKCWERR
jgi:hypothetical protein